MHIDDRGRIWRLATTVALAGTLSGCPQEPAPEDASSHDARADAPLPCPSECGDGAICFEGRCCLPRTCPAGRHGLFDDYCGGMIACSCGPGQAPQPDGTCACEPRTCESVGAECGSIADGCGGIARCGSCAGTTPYCGPGNRCQSTPCEPRSCDDGGAQCGFADDGCGEAVDCGGCGSGEMCEDNQCIVCPGGDCGRMPACDAAALRVSCPDLPCEEAVGCNADRTCRYESMTCAEAAGTCPVQECSSTRIDGGGGAVFFTNVCRVVDGAPCGTCPGIECGRCVGSRCVVDGRRVTGTISVAPYSGTVGTRTVAGGFDPVTAGWQGESAPARPSGCAPDAVCWTGDRSCRGEVCVEGGIAVSGRFTGGSLGP